MDFEDFVREGEGTKFHPYKDTKHIWTIGVGRNIEANPLTREEMSFALGHGGMKNIKPRNKEYWLEHGNKYAFKFGLNKSTVEHVFSNDRVTAKKDARAIFGRAQMAQLSKARRFVLQDMALNMGRTKFSKFTELRKAIPQGNRTGNFRWAAKEIISSNYANDVSSRALKNTFLMLKGDFKKKKFSLKKLTK